MFNIHIFNDRLNDEIGFANRLLDIGRRLEALQSRLHKLGLFGFAVLMLLFRDALQILGNTCLCLAQDIWTEVAKRDIVTRRCRDLGRDTQTHQNDDPQNHDHKTITIKVQSSIKTHIQNRSE